MTLEANLSVPRIALQQLEKYLPLIDQLARTPGVEMISWSQFNLLLGPTLISPPEWNPNRSFEERSRMRLFFGWEHITSSSNSPRITHLEVSSSSPYQTLAIQTIQAADNFLSRVIRDLGLPHLAVRPMPYAIRGREDLRGWYYFGSSSKAHYVSFLQHGYSLPEGETTCKIKVALYELTPAGKFGADLHSCCMGCLRG